MDVELGLFVHEGHKTAGKLELVHEILPSL